MAAKQPVTTVGALVAQATQSIANINAHRAAMAQVAAQVKAAPKPQPVGGVKE